MVGKVNPNAQGLVLTFILALAEIAHRVVFGGAGTSPQANNVKGAAQAVFGQVASAGPTTALATRAIQMASTTVLREGVKAAPLLLAAPPVATAAGSTAAGAALGGIGAGFNAAYTAAAGAASAAASTLTGLLPSVSLATAVWAATSLYFAYQCWKGNGNGVTVNNNNHVNTNTPVTLNLNLPKGVHTVEKTETADGTFVTVTVSDKPNTEKLRLKDVVQKVMAQQKPMPVASAPTAAPVA